MLLIGIVVLVTGATYWWLTRGPREDAAASTRVTAAAPVPVVPRDAPAPSDSAEERTTIPGTPAEVASPLESSTAPVPQFDPAAFDRRALPAPTARLADVYEELKRAAEAGNAVAACRLGTGLLRCRQVLEQDQRRIARLLDTAARHDIPPAEGQAAAAAEAILGERADTLAARPGQTNRCEELPSAALTEAEDWLLAAIARGNRHAIERFLLDFRLDSPSTLARPEMVALFREEAPALAERAAATGSLAVIPELVRAYAGLAPETPLGMALPRDLARARALALLYIEEAQATARELPAIAPGARDLNAGEGGRLLAMSSLGLTSEQALAAQALARALFDERERTRAAFREQVVAAGVFSHRDFEPCIR